MTTRLHVVGCRRSGTTLMMELLWYSYVFSGRHQHEISVFEPVPEGQTLYLTKKPPDTLRIQRILEADSRLHVIAMLRDPRAVITSTHESKPGVYYAGYKRWREYVDAIDRLRPHPRFLVIRYEDLVSQPNEVQADVNHRFPFLEQQRSFAQYPAGADVPATAAQSLNGVRPFDPSRINGWREHLPRVNGQLRAHPSMPADLVRAGYETGEKWTRILEGVGFYSQDYKDAGPGFFRRLETDFRFWLKTRRYLHALDD